MVINGKCYLCGSNAKNVLDHLQKKHMLSGKEAESTVQFMCAEAENLNGKTTPTIRLTLTSPNQKPASRKSSAVGIVKKRVRFDDRSIAIRKYSTTN
ncbi:hypothetical protein M3Y97_00542000 [Aphelenchoides bicaudatus]|nr:hypothetical protein M3Y97_00542000 [Aphelenchoides bicaudatus]